MAGFGVIGLGAVSDAHLAGLSSIEGVEIVAVCDLDADRANEVAQRFGARPYVDALSCIADDRVDAVLILLPHSLHHPVAAAALRAKKHVCVEKPMALTAAECRELCQLAEANGVRLGVAENSRYVDAYISAARLVQSGELGEVRLIRGFVYGSALPNYLRKDSGWRIEPGGIGAIIDAAPHHLHLLHWIFGDLDSIRATTRSWVRDNLVPAMSVEDGALLDGRLKTGGYWSVEVSLSTEIPWGERLEIYGSRKSIVIDQLAAEPMRVIAGPQDLLSSGEESIAHDPNGWQPKSIAAAAADFASAVIEDRPPLVTGEDGLWTAVAIDAAYRSAAQGGASISLTADDESAPASSAPASTL